jgi:hypothetical protein
MKNLVAYKKECVQYKFQIIRSTDRSGSQKLIILSATLRAKYFGLTDIGILQKFIPAKVFTHKSF